MNTGSMLSIKNLELSHSILLDEDVLKKTSEQQRALYIFEWLKYIDKALLTAEKSDIKQCQNKLVKQLTELMNHSPGPPIRKLLSNCLATLFSVGDTFIMFDTVNACNDILKNKDDAPSFLPTKLAAICIVGCMYEKLGRLMGRSYEETVQILVKSLRNAESQIRIEIMKTLEKVCSGMGSAISNVHKDIFKATKFCLTDRNMSVRVASANCIIEMINHAPFIYSTELESLASLCFRAFDGSNYEVRCAVAKLLGTLLASTQQNDLTKKQINTSQKVLLKSISLEEALGILMSGFLRGGPSFLKGTGEIIKGSSSVNREVRVGVTHSYVMFVQIMGSVWFEKNLNIFFIHILELVSNAKAASSHVDAVYSRKCINFILRSVNGKMLGEKAQTSACKEIVKIISKKMRSMDFSPENAKDSNQETLFSQHLLVCALQELACLTMSLGTSILNLLNDNSLIFIDTIYSVLTHPSSAARLAASWCLRSVCVACPNQITPLIDKLIEAIEKQKSPEAISGYSSALAAVVGSVRYSPLGIPHTKGKIIFNTAEELLRSASQNSRMSLHRTQTGWLLLGSIMTLGSSVVRGVLPRLLLLWRNSFPKSAKDLESEKARGDSFTWQVTLEGRAGALSVMFSFLQNCNDLVNDDIIKKMFSPIESALAMLVNLSSILKTYGQQLKASIAMVRLRLYETLSLLPPSALESSYTHLLRMLVAEFTLAENPANTTNSLLRGLCHGEDSIIMGTWLEEADHKDIEDQLQPNSAAGSGAIEHDSCCLYRIVRLKNQCPGPLPLGIAVIDMSIILFGLVFPRAANKHRLQMLEHFGECIRQAKSVRQEAVQLNVFAALLTGLKGLTDSKSNFGQEDVKRNATILIISALGSSNSTLRCAAGEAIGRMAQVAGEPKFTAEMSQNIFDKLKSARDVVTRTGHSLALGCLHRYVGGMGSSQHLNTSVSILLALAQDTSSPVVQVWSLSSLSLIADSGGPMFRGYVEATLSLCLKLLLSVAQSNVDVHQCIGRVLNALITTMGPELQGDSSSIVLMRSSFLGAASILQSHSDPLVQAEATGCLQQLHLFAPKYVILSSLVPTLVKTLSSNYLMLRKAAVSCLRQLSQREAKEVCYNALLVENITHDFGLPGILFAMLDKEVDLEMIKNIHDTLTSMLQMMVSDNLTTWLNLCKSVLTVNNDSFNEELPKTCDDEEDGDNDDDLEYHAAENVTTHPAVQPRWPTRVFAAECVRKIITTCETTDPTHFDLVKAKELQMTKNRADYLILHLSDLIRMSFMAATSDSDQLKLEGLRTLQEIIDKFAGVPEPEFPGHLLLEQFQAQVGAALRPAFSSETPCHVTAAACEVCSAWIGSGVARDLNDLRRVHHLLVSSLSKLHEKTSTTQLYNESMATLEKLSILKAWAEVYIVAMIGNSSAPANKLQNKLSCFAQNNIFINTSLESEQFWDIDNRGDSLLSLVEPELPNLSKHWLDALKDHALLRLPYEYQNQLPHDGGAFFTTDTINSSKPHYLSSWPPILYAASLWLNNGGFEQKNHNVLNDDVNQNNPEDSNISKDRFHMIFGICMEALCSSRTSERSKNVLSSLQSLYTIISSDWAKALLVKNKSLTIELCNVLHRQILIHDDIFIQLLCIEILQQTIIASLSRLEEERVSTNTDAITSSLNEMGEGGISGDIIPGKSHVYSVLEVCLCIFVRYIPSMNPSTYSVSETYQKLSTLSDDNGLLIASGLNCAGLLTGLCSPKGALSIVSTILYMTTTILKELARKSSTGSKVISETVPIQSALLCLKSVCTDKYSNDGRSSEQWKQLLRSTLASIIDMTKTGCDSDDKEKMDEVTMLKAISVFILNTGAFVVTTPSLQYPCINLFRQCLQSEDKIVKLKCIEAIKSIFTKTDVKISTPYIHALAPRIVEKLYSEETKHPKDELDVACVLESIAVIESLINLAEPENRIQMLTLVVPVLISYLSDPTKLRSLTKYQRQLHDQSLQWLVKIGPKYPDEFKTLMSQTNGLRQRLEISIRHKQQVNNNRTNTSESFQSGKDVNLNQKPTITLKTDFSNFG